jgi:beta-lactamase regulating signal transducer with metallopeptidase domain
MSLLLALQAAVIYAVALLAARTGPAAHRRAVLLGAVVLVAALPVFALAPHWSPAGAGPAAVPAAVRVLQEPGSAASTREVVAAAPGALSVGAVLSAVWWVGFVVQLVRLGADLLAAHRLRATARDLDGDVAYTEALDVPVVVGIVRPLVLLPAAAVGWTRARRDLVLAHERAHAQGRDNLWLLLARLGACVHWFDPFAWWGVSALRDACEHHADDAVLQGGGDRVVYAQTLVDLARYRAPAAALPMAQPSGLERRVRAVLAERPPVRRLGGFVRAGLVAALAVGTATAGTTPTPRAREGLAARLEAEADHLVATHHAEGVALLVVDVRSGAVLGRAERGGLAERPVSPGSVLKPFTMVAALEQGVPRETVFTDGDMVSILACSSNPGAVEVATRAGRPALEGVLHRVGLPTPAEVSLDRLVLGDVRVTPLQVAAAWTHLGGHGALAPQLAAEVRELLVGAVESENATGKEAAVPGLRIAGKTGTAQLVRADGTPDADQVLASFVGLVPADEPEVVVLVAVAGPQGEARWGGTVAAPAFRRIVEGNW